ncbi:hypothetical protein M3J09_012781 [Ascochyta lentis]
MGSSTNPLRHIWARSQVPIPPSSELLVNFDGASDGLSDGQKMHDTFPQQHLNERVPNGNGISSPSPDHPEATRAENGQRPVVLYQYGQPPQQVAAHQDEVTHHGTHNFAEAMQEPEDRQQGQFEKETPQQYGRPLPSLPHTAPLQHVVADGHVRDSGLSNTSANASAKVPVKQEPTVEGGDDYDVFAEFTNQDSDDDDAHAGTGSQAGTEGTEDAGQAPLDLPLVKQEPRAEEQLHGDTTELAASVDSVITATHNTDKAPGTALGQATTTSAIEGAILPETKSDNSEAFGTFDQRSWPTSQCTSQAGPAVSGRQFPLEQHVPNSQQPEFSTHANDKTRGSPSADSVIGPQCQSSDETALSLQDVDPSSLRAQQWQQWQQQRHQLRGGDVLTAEATQAKPSLLRDPISVQQQHGLYATRPVPNVQYSMSMQYPSQVASSQHGQVHSYTMAPGYAYNPLMQHAPSSGYPLLQAHLTQYPTSQRTLVVEAGKPGVSDDDEPLVTRVPRHRSTSVSRDSRSPFGAAISPSQQQGVSSKTTKSTEASPKPNVSDGKANSILELSDGDEPTEPISWKLPTYEVIYQPPATLADLPSAKISIPKLIREEILLAPDHADQEVQLFLDVFLPAQRALETPDPEPAHAVLNFHTIAIMVLEAFVQFEIGDELGRGYGFHGGHSAQRPDSSSSDSEPARTRSAHDANVDDIFFAVIDRWRAGMESGKETAKLVRGCQEFCDVALDVIHYVKVHGLLQPETKKRKERSDKGVVRGPRGGGANDKGKEKEKENPKTPTKRKADALDKKTGKSTNVNELQGRKKVKVDAKSQSQSQAKPKPKVRAKPKSSVPGVIVISGKK